MNCYAGTNLAFGQLKFPRFYVTGFKYTKLGSERGKLICGSQNEIWTEVNYLSLRQKILRQSLRLKPEK